jgi:hypothetical protein
MSKDSGSDADLDDYNVKFCEWATFRGSRCSSKIKKSGECFCPKHKNLSTIYKVLSENYVTVNKIRCSTTKLVKIEPRSRDYLITIMKDYGYKETLKMDSVSVDISIKGCGSVESACIDSELYIQSDVDGKRFYYKADKGQGKTKDIKILLTKMCRNVPEYQIDEDYYCKDCYIICAKKSGYPTLKTLKNVVHIDSEQRYTDKNESEKEAKESEESEES